MPKLRSVMEIPLDQEIAAYLRTRREESELSQHTLAKRGRALGAEFDHSWVSQWERVGPRPSFVKCLVYLKLIDADLGLINDMIRAKVRFPTSVPVSADEAVTRSAALTFDGKLDRALGMVIASQRAFGSKTPEVSARLNLTGSIVSRRAELLFLARQFARAALRVTRENEVGTELAAKVTIENANVAMFHGELVSAAELLNRLNESVLARDASLRAPLGYAKALLLRERGELQLAIEQYESCLSLYGAREGRYETPRVLAAIGHLRALSGDVERALESSRAALSAAKELRSPLIEGDVRYRIGRAHTVAGRHAAALKLLTGAEKLARETGRPLGQFRIHLALLELGLACQEPTLVRMLRQRLRRDRQALMLTPVLSREYEQLAAAPCPGD